MFSCVSHKLCGYTIVCLRSIGVYSRKWLESLEEVVNKDTDKEAHVPASVFIIADCWKTETASVDPIRRDRSFRRHKKSFLQQRRRIESVDRYRSVARVRVRGTGTKDVATIPASRTAGTRQWQRAPSHSQLALGNLIFLRYKKRRWPSLLRGGGMSGEKAGLKSHGAESLVRVFLENYENMCKMVYMSHFSNGALKVGTWLTSRLPGQLFNGKRGGQQCLNCYARIW